MTTVTTTRPRTRKTNQIMIQEDGTCVMLLESKKPGNRSTYFDAEHLPEVPPYWWHLHKQPGGQFYCSRTIKVGGKKALLFLHQVVCPSETNLVADFTTIHFFSAKW